MLSGFEQPHRRFNPLTADWVLVSPHRTRRPWKGQTEEAFAETRPPYVPDCYLCPGNLRAGGVHNPNYQQTFVFENDFAALLPDTPPSLIVNDNLLHANAVDGCCRVICFSPRHDLTLPELPDLQIRQIIDVWADQTAELINRYRWVQVFENKGEVMGCSNPHPHGQIWAVNALPNEPAREDTQQALYYRSHGRHLLLDYLDQEEHLNERIILKNESWLVVVPFWAVWPFETLLLPRRPVARLPDLFPDERQALAEILRRLLIRYDNLFETSFPYSMGWHGAPGLDSPAIHWQLHAHFYPPLLRSATVKKFMVGYEMLGEAQRDLTAEQAAFRLREVSEIHYKSKQV